MSLGGRPKEEEGHTPLKISVNKFVSEALQKVDNKSQFIEKAVKPILEQLDPGPGCVSIQRIDKLIQEEIGKAVRDRDYAKVQTLGNMAEQLKDYRHLCNLPDIRMPHIPPSKNIPSESNPLGKVYDPAPSPIAASPVEEREWVPKLSRGIAKSMFGRDGSLELLEAGGAFLKSPECDVLLNGIRSLSNKRSK